MYNSLIRHKYHSRVLLSLIVFTVYIITYFLIYTHIKDYITRGYYLSFGKIRILLSLSSSRVSHYARLIRSAWSRPSLSLFVIRVTSLCHSNLFASRAFVCILGLFAYRLCARRYAAATFVLSYNNTRNSVV